MRAYLIAALLLALAPPSLGQAVAHYGKIHTRPARGDADFAVVVRPGECSHTLLPNLQNVMEVENVSTDPAADVYVGFEYDPTAPGQVKISQVIGDPHAIVILTPFFQNFRGADFHFGDDSEVLWRYAGGTGGPLNYANLYLGKRSKFFTQIGSDTPQVILPNGTKITPSGRDHYAMFNFLPSSSTSFPPGYVVFRDGFAKPEPGLLPAPPDVFGCTTDVVLAPGSPNVAVGTNWITNWMHDPNATVIGCVEPDLDGLPSYFPGYCTQLFFPDNTLAEVSLDARGPINVLTYGYPAITFGENVHLVVHDYNYAHQPLIYNPLVTRRGVTLSLNMPGIHGGVEDHSGNFIWGDPQVSLPPGMTSQLDPSFWLGGPSILIVTK